MTYAYDNANQVTQATYGTPLPNPLNKRVTGAIENSAGNITSEVFAYDSNGNNTSLAIGSNNQLTSDGAYTYTYDDEGRPISRSSGTITTTYVWDHRGRLVSVMEDHGGTPVAGAVDGVSVEYRYDAFDRQIFKDVGQTVWFDMCVVAICQPGVTMLVPQHAPGAQRYYVYDGQHIAVELLNITDDGSASGDVAKRFMHGTSIDEVLGEEHFGQFQWTFGDHLGTIRDSLTISGSSTHYVYSTFGQLLTGSALTFGYTGRETDSDTLLADNWMYYRARYYDSHTGRFVSQDPIGYNAGDANLYRYVGNGPAGASDPSGLQERYTPTSGMDFQFDTLASEITKRQMRLWNTIINDAQRRGFPTKILLDAMRSRVQITAQQTGASYRPGALNCGIIGLANDTLKRIEKGNISRQDLMLIYNEAFHALMHRVGYSVPWLVELMTAEEFPRNPTLFDRISTYDQGLDMAEEAMSESISRFLLPIDPTLVGRKRRSADLNQICGSPGHSDLGDKWHGIDGAKRPISAKLGIALIWILENGGATPPEFGLQEWYDRRWSPTRAKTPSVDVNGNPR